MVNTELNSGNFLINEGARSYLVDWEKPLLSEAAQDLAHFLAPTTTFWKTDTILDREAVGQAVYLNMIAKAKKYIYITTPYLIIDVATNTALCNAAKSG